MVTESEGRYLEVNSQDPALSFSSLLNHPYKTHVLPGLR